MYIGESDLVLMQSVTDIAGINRLSARVIASSSASSVVVTSSTPASHPCAAKRLEGAAAGPRHMKHQDLVVARLKPAR